MAVNPRIEIEQGVVDLLLPLKVDKKLKWVESIGGADYETLLRAALGAAPFTAVKFTGKSANVMGGGVTEFSAQVSVLIGAKSFKSLVDQRMDIYDLLDKIETALGGARLPSAAGSDVYFPLVPVTEQWSALSGGAIEVWEQIWQVRWRQSFGV